MYRNDNNDSRFGPSEEYNPEAIEVFKDFVKENKGWSVVVAIVIVLLGALTAWGLSGGGESKVVSGTDRYLETVMPMVGIYSESEMLTYGYDLCYYLDQVSVYEVVDHLANYDNYLLPDRVKGEILKAATSSLCVEHSSELNRFIKRYGN